MTVSIVIPTYNRAHSVGITLTSFAAQNFPKKSFEIIVVDNNSVDDTKKVIATFKKAHPEISLTYLFEPRQGNHYARHKGAKKAKHDILYFTDDDMIADPELLTEVIKPFTFDPDVAVSTGRVLPKWEVKPPSWVEKYCQNSLLSLMNPPEDFVITKSINSLYSCHQAIRKDVFYKIEGFNPDYFSGLLLGDGETGLNLKIMELGYKFGYNGKSVIYHIIPQKRMTQDYLNKRMSNSGYSHAYTTYRRSTPSNASLILANMKTVCYQLPIHFITYVIRTIWQRDPSLTRFFIAYTFYYRSRMRYNTWLMKNQALRAFVLKRDWLTHDQDIQPEVSKYFRK